MRRRHASLDDNDRLIEERLALDRALPRLLGGRIAGEPVASAALWVV